MNHIPIIILFLVFLLIAVRQIGKIKFQIWQIMLSGALLVLIFKNISPKEAILAIDFDVILFLTGMFIVGCALEESGYLSHLTYKIFKRMKTIDSLLLSIIFVMGFLSAFLMNDTLAIIGTPVVLTLAKNHKMPAKILLLALAFSITTGSVLSPIGNPQNLLIALHTDLKNPFFIFFKYLFLPTVINLFMIYFILRIFYKKHFHKETLKHSQEPIKDKKLAILSKISLYIIFIMIVLKIFMILFNLKMELKLTFIALSGALPIILFSSKRFKIIKKADWSTIVFFMAMFILMKSVWNTGFFQSFLNGFKINSSGFILLSSLILSQFISNVPLVALFLPILTHTSAGIKEFMLLASGSTIAGNLLVLGAASNVIIIQNAEKRDEHSLNYIRFAKFGILITIIQTIIYWIFLR